MLRNVHVFLSAFVFLSLTFLFAGCSNRAVEREINDEDSYVSMQDSLLNGKARALKRRIELSHLADGESVDKIEVSLNGLEIEEPEQLPAYDELKAIEEKGAVICVFWHPKNLITGGESDDCSEYGVADAVTGNGVKSVMYKRWLRLVAEWFKTNQDMAFVFLPYDGVCGKEHWYCERYNSDESIIALFKDMKSVFAENGVHNVLFGFRNKENFTNGKITFEVEI